MGQPLKLECFDTDTAAGPSLLVLPEARLEEERLQAFDKGYKAGWDDASTAHASQQASISQEFAGNLQRMAFTYHEARSTVLSEMEGILRGVIEKVLPNALRSSLGEMILERLWEVADTASDVPVEIVVAPENTERLNQLICGKVAPPVNVREEPSLGAGQAYLRLGRTESKLDLDSVLLEISGAVAGFFETDKTDKTDKEAHHA